MTIETIKATDDLVIDGRSYFGCPLVLRNGSLDFVPSRWLAHLWWRRSHDTVRAYARQCTPFLSYLEDCRVAWWDVSAGDIEAYQARMHLAGYAATSINLSLQSIQSFYDFCSTRGYTTHKPFVLSMSRRQGFQGLTTPVSPLTETKKMPRIIGRKDFDRVLASIPTDSDEVLFRTELTFECGRYMGLRRQEVAGLTCTALEAVPDDDTSMALLHLDGKTTKGGRERDVLIPRGLLRRLDRYVSVYRTETICRAAARVRRYDYPKNLFLTLTGAPLSREYISASWRAAARKAGIDASFHSNRHWFGTTVVAAAKRLRLADPLREAANLLGHANVTTTMIYDHSLLELDADELDVMSNHLAWGHHETR